MRRPSLFKKKVLVVYMVDAVHRLVPVNCILFLPVATEESEKEDETAEGQLDGHGCPDTAKTVAGGQKGGQRQSDTPHGGQTHDGWLQRVGGTDEHAVGHD